MRYDVFPKLYLIKKMVMATQVNKWRKRVIIQYYPIQERFMPPRSQSRFLSRYWLGLVLCLVIVCHANAQERSSAKAGTPVEMALPVQETWFDRIEILGTVRANHSLELRSKISERIVSLNFEDGSRVQKGDLLLQLDDREEQAVLASARAVLEERRSALKRAEQLFSRKVGSEADLDAAKARVSESEANIEALKVQIAEHRITAPFSGQLGFRNVSVGTLLSPSDVITTLDDLSTVKADFDVPTAFLSRLQTNRKLEAFSHAYPGQTFGGTLQSVGSRIDPQTRTIRVRAQFPNPNRKLLPGLLMQAVLQSTPRTNLTLPENAVFAVGQNHYVFVVRREGEKLLASLKSIAIGARKTGWVEVLDGLSPDEQVVTQGRQKLRDGDQVTDIQANAS